MTKITNISDFKNVTSSITSFSHAYLLNVNSLDSAFVYAKEFAKRIILENIKDNSFEYEDINYKIDHDEFDDLYVVNPDTIGINNEEINKLFSYMETKSLRENGRRVYIIYGFERLSTLISNKILKFLEEPQDNIYAILLTENFEKILSLNDESKVDIELYMSNDQEKIKLLKKINFVIIGFNDIGFNIAILLNKLNLGEKITIVGLNKNENYQKICNLKETYTLI